MQFLVTGFEPFANHEANPSQLVVEHLAAEPIAGIVTTTTVLPVQYDKADIALQRAIRTTQPDAVLMLGLSAESAAITLERFALNIDDSATTDNSGALRLGNVIAEAGPAAYTSTLPIEAIEAGLRSAGIPVIISNHAGTFLCNHCFYLARHQLPPNTPCGFVHLPPSAPIAEDGTFLALTIQQQAVRQILQIAAQALR